MLLLPLLSLWLCHHHSHKPCHNRTYYSASERFVNFSSARSIFLSWLSCITRQFPTSTTTASWVPVWWRGRERRERRDDRKKKWRKDANKKNVVQNNNNVIASRASDRRARKPQNERNGSRTKCQVLHEHWVVRSLHWNLVLSYVAASIRYHSPFRVSTSHQFVNYWLWRGRCTRSPHIIVCLRVPFRATPRLCAEHFRKHKALCSHLERKNETKKSRKNRLNCFIAIAFVLVFLERTQSEAVRIQNIVRT